MAGLFSSDAKVLVIGANHRSSSLALRDRLFLDEPEVIPFLDKLKDDGVEQCLVVSTCDRVEVHCVDHNPARAHELIVARLAERAELDSHTIASQLYVHEGEEAVRHIFRVAASLDSLMVGEPQVVAQVKDAHRLAVEAGSVGSELERIFSGRLWNGETGAYRNCGGRTSGFHCVSCSANRQGIAWGSEPLPGSVNRGGRYGGANRAKPD